MANLTKAEQNFIQKVRNHKLFGSQTMSVINECFSDNELLEDFFNYDKNYGSLTAVKEYHNDYMGTMKNAIELSKNCMW